MAKQGRKCMFDNRGLVLDDDDIVIFGDFFEITSKKIDMQFEELVSTLTAASENAFIEGKTAEALRVYVNQLKTLCGMIAEYGSACKSLIEGFKDRIDEIDKDLY